MSIIPKRKQKVVKADMMGFSVRLEQKIPTHK